MKTILVTGGAGFIGKALCSRLLQNGHKVISLDRVKNDECYSLLHDITNPLPNIKVDEIYNLAGTPSPAKYMKNPIYTTKTNVLGVINVLELAKSCKAKVLQASTGEVYEDLDWTDNRSCYRQGKRMAESLFFDYHRTESVNIRIARMFNSYGPGMSLDDGKVIPVFIQRAIKGEDITVFGESTRSFCYIDDMVEALILLMESTKTEPVNICGEEEITMKDLAVKIKQITQSNSQIFSKPKLENDSSQKNPTTNLAQNELGWAPKISLECGLKNTINYFRSFYVV